MLTCLAFRRRPLRFLAWSVLFVPVVSVFFSTLSIVVPFSISQKQQESPSSSTSNLQRGLPNVLIIGAQKAGTSSTARQLTSHPHVCGPRIDGRDRKETHMLCRRHPNITKYKEMFAHCLQQPNNDNSTTSPQWLLDATPMYMIYPERVHSFYQKHGILSDLKLIAILREPVSREVSAFRMNARSHPHLLRHVSFEWYNRLYPLRGLSHPHLLRYRGSYAYWLTQWMRYFDRQQLLILSFDELNQNKTRFFERLRSFLSLTVHLLDTNLPLARPEVRPVTTNVSCAAQVALARALEGPNEDFYQWHAANVGPNMEQSPFPRFAFQCT